MELSAIAQPIGAASASTTAGVQPHAATGSMIPGKDLPHAGERPPPISIDKAIEQIQAFLSESRRQLTFERHEASGRTIIRVLDAATGEVIRQFPSEEILRIAGMLDAGANAHGLLLPDEQA